MQYLGLARDLRRRVAASDAQMVPAMQSIVAPLQDRLSRHPVLRRPKLIDAERRWRALPVLATRVDIANPRRPVFDALHGAPAAYRSPDWLDDVDEAGVAVMLTSAEVVGRRFVLDLRGPVLAISLHALGRRYERGFGGDDAIIAEITALAFQYRKIAERGGQFAWRGWLGMVVELAGGEVCASVRTYWPDADADAPLRLAA
jgi:hypothetical protein